MSAWDTFTALSGALSEHEREVLKDLLRNVRTDLLAARSEEARVRIADDLLREAREFLKHVKK